VLTCELDLTFGDENQVKLGSRKYNEAIGRDHDICGGRETMQRRARCTDASTVAVYDWIHKVIVDITVKHLAPRTGEWKTDSVVVPGIFGERGHDNYVLPAALHG